MRAGRHTDRRTDTIIVTLCNNFNKYHLSLTNTRDALPHGKRAANKRGRLV